MTAASALTVTAALAQARAEGLDRLDAQLLLAHHLGRPRTWLMANDEAVIAGAQAQAFAADCARRAAGIPLAYLLGWREFHGLRLQVSPDVLVPRPDTECLVEWALECLSPSTNPPMQATADVLATSAAQRPPQVLDLGTGSGAVALAVAHALKATATAAQVTATDLSPSALRMASLNAHALGLAVELIPGAWWQAVAGRQFDLVVSNPPYIAEGDQHLAALHAEPMLALVSGHDGLGALREIVAGSPPHLRPGAWLLLEHGFDQATAVQGLLQAAGFEAIATRQDLAGLPRCSGGRWPNGSPSTVLPPSPGAT